MGIALRSSSSAADQSGSTFTVWADGVALTTFSDAQRPYLSGVIGLYSEDAVVHFDDVTW